LPGCERGTIDFFKQYLPDSFDGLLLPRNHDGTLPLTKGHAAANVVKMLPPADSEVIGFHIDDSSHHNASFRQQMGQFATAHIATFQPEYLSHIPLDEGSTHTKTPLQAFQAASLFLQSHL
jgi:hypothetical protein